MQERAEKAHRVLQDPQRMARQIEALQARQQAFRDSAGVSGIRYDGVRVQTSKTGSTVETAAVKAADLQKQIDRLQQRRVRLLLDVDAALSKIRDPEQQYVLVAFYVSGAALADVANELHRCRSGVYRLREAALLAFWDAWTAAGHSE